MAQHDVLTVKDLPVECHLSLSITHPGREGRIIAGNSDVDWGEHVVCQLDGNLDVAFVVNRLDVNGLPVYNK